MPWTAIRGRDATVSGAGRRTPLRARLGSLDGSALLLVAAGARLKKHVRLVAAEPVVSQPVEDWGQTNGSCLAALNDLMCWNASGRWDDLPAAKLAKSCDADVVVLLVTGTSDGGAAPVLDSKLLRRTDAASFTYAVVSTRAPDIAAAITHEISHLLGCDESGKVEIWEAPGAADRIAQNGPWLAQVKSAGNGVPMPKYIPEAEP